VILYIAVLSLETSISFVPEFFAQSICYNIEDVYTVVNLAHDCFFNMHELDCLSFPHDPSQRNIPIIKVTHAGVVLN
jgi:hypothetical protein